jgi:hypothetical protein
MAKKTGTSAKRASLVAAARIFFRLVRMEERTARLAWRAFSAVMTLLMADL